MYHQVFFILFNQVFGERRFNDGYFKNNLLDSGQKSNTLPSDDVNVKKTNISLFFFIRHFLCRWKEHVFAKVTGTGSVRVLYTMWLISPKKVIFLEKIIISYFRMSINIRYLAIEIYRDKEFYKRFFALISIYLYIYRDEVLIIFCIFLALMKS